MSGNQKAWRLLRRYTYSDYHFFGFPSYESAKRFGDRFKDRDGVEEYHPEEYEGEVYRNEGGAVLNPDGSIQKTVSFY